MISLLIIITISKICFGEVRISPETTKTKPLRDLKTFEIVPISPNLYEKDDIIIVESFSSLNASKLLKQTNTTFRIPFVELYHASAHPNSNWTQSFPEYIRITIISNSTQNILFRDSDDQIRTIYWDFRYSSLRFSFTYEEDDEFPGSVWVIANPESDLDAYLDSLTKFYWFYHIEYTTYPSYITDPQMFGYNCDVHQGSENNKALFSFPRPRIMYFQLQACTSHGSGYPASSGLCANWQPQNLSSSSYKYTGGAVVLCYSNGTCPQLVSGFKGSVYYIQKKIPFVTNEIQLPLMKKNLSVFEGYPIYFPYHGKAYLTSPSFLEVLLDSRAMTFDSYIGVSILSKTYDTIDTWKIIYKVSIGSAAEYVRFAFAFNSTNIVFGKKYPLCLRLQGAQWQNLTLTAVKLSPVKKTPSLLQVAFTWSSLSDYKNLDVYKSISFSQIPGPSYCSMGDSGYSEATMKNLWGKERRSLNYSKLSFCPENSLFYCDSTQYKMCNMFTAIKTLDYTATAVKCFPSTLNSTEYNLELQKLKNSVDFFIATGVTDFAYDGIILKQQLKGFTNYLNITEPECINFDIEDFTYIYAFTSKISQSVNAQNRKKSGETDSKLSERIWNEFLQGIKDCFDATVPNAIISWYGTDASSNYGNSYGKFSQYRSILGENFVQQPEFYVHIKHPSNVRNVVKGGKKYIDKGDLIIPMPSLGCYGEYSPYLVFDWVIHMLLSGANGFQIFVNFNVDDHADLLFLKEGIEIVTDFEEIIFYGDSADQFISENENCIISGFTNVFNKTIGSAVKYVYAVSPNYNPNYDFSRNKLSFHFENRFNELFFIVNDLRRNQNQIKYTTDSTGLVIELDSDQATVIEIIVHTDLASLAIALSIIIFIVAIVSLIFSFFLILLFLILFRKKKASKF